MIWGFHVIKFVCSIGFPASFLFDAILTGGTRSERKNPVRCADGFVRLKVSRLLQQFNRHVSSIEIFIELKASEQKLGNNLVNSPQTFKFSGFAKVCMEKVYFHYFLLDR